MSRRWRVHHPGPLPAAGALIELDATEAQHVRRVLRLASGAEIAVFDDGGREWTARLEAVDGARVSARLEHPIDAPVEAPVRVLLFQALCRTPHVEWLVQKATELGVSSVTLVATERSEGRAPGPARLARWRRIAIESCKQCGRRVIPDVAWAEELPDPRGAHSIALDPRAAAPALGAVCAGGDPPAEVRLLSGPEAGLTDEELRALAARGWRPARLGPRVLRAETAGLVAAAIVLHRWGDLGNGPGV